MLYLIEQASNPKLLLQIYIKESFGVQQSVLIWFKLSFGAQAVSLLAIEDTPNLLSPPTCIFWSLKMENGAAGKRPAAQHMVFHHNIY